VTCADQVAALPRPSWACLLRSQVLKRLEALKGGRLILHEGAQTHVLGLAGEPVDLLVRRPAFWSAVALGGGTGAADAYAAGHWECPDLVGLTRLMVRNRDLLLGLDGGLARVAGLAARLAHRLRGNSLAGSRRNIAAHYDLGNEFYRLFLDETLSYSAAYWSEPGLSLAEAQRAKIERLCRQLELSPQDHLLEIGTGWGALAIHAAQVHGCRVTTTTISAEQRRHALAAVRAAGLEERVTVLDQDYRTLTGQYDKLVSVEMIEAVGHEHLGGFVETCSRLLKPTGRLALQAITFPDRHYAGYRRRADFIQSRIFPGSCLVSLAHLLEQLQRRSDLRPTGLTDITPHYARTLAAWRGQLHARWSEARALDLPEEFLRLWDYYLAYCEGGFREQFIGDVQLVLSKPLDRPGEACLEV